MLQTDFVGDLGKMGIKYRMLDMAGLERLKDSKPEEPCPMFIKPHHRRRRKRATEGQAEMDHHDEGHGEGKSTVYIRTVRGIKYRMLDMAGLERLHGIS